MTPELAAERFAAAATVKSNPVREVRTDGKYFYKLDRRNRSFAGEFAAAKLLEARRIPVVEHLWHGRIPEGALLVTRALPGAPTVREYISSRIPDGAFQRNFAAFIREFLESKLGHDDLHIGNILYLEEEKRFVLVDVRAVRKFRLRRFPYNICRAVLELRKHLRRDELCAMLELIGHPDPERFCERALEIEAGALNREWPKRRAQILAGYPKFTRVEGTRLVAADATEEELAQLEPLPGSEGEFCSAFYWELAQIPHRRVLTFDRAEHTIGVAPERCSTPLPAAEIAARKRLYGAD